MYKAIFSNGLELTRTSKRTYTHAWISMKDGQVIQNGFSSNAVAAEKAAKRAIAFELSCGFRHQRYENAKKCSLEVVVCH